MKRFVNADSLASTGQDFIGYNMFAYCNNNPANSSDPCGTCIHNWRFYNCERCNAFWRGVSEWIADTYDRTSDVRQQQAQIQTQITMQQIQMVSDLYETSWDAYEHSIELEVQAQYQRDMTVIAVGEYYAANPQIAVDHAFAIIGACELYASCVLSGGATAPVVVSSALKSAGKVGVVWGIYRMLVDIFEVVAQGGN